MGGADILPLGPTPDTTMRRPHVYERSVPRARRDSYQEPDRDDVQAARTVLRALPALTAAAETAGLGRLADLLDAVRDEAEHVCGEQPRPARDRPD